jgi:hypothetical protein
MATLFYDSAIDRHVVLCVRHGYRRAFGRRANAVTMFEYHLEQTHGGDDALIADELRAG